MESVVLVVHLILALAIIGLVLLQRSEGGGLGIGGGGGGGGGLGGFASARGTANALTKMTALCATGFFITSLTLAVLASSQSREATGILENVDPAKVEAPVSNDDSGVSVTYTPPTGGVPETDTENKDETEKPSAPIE